MSELDSVYERGEEIGRGGMGVVYRARHRNLDRPVALKVLALEDDGEVAAVARFKREAMTVRNLVHENVVRLLDYDLEAKPPFLVFELIEGGRTLEDILERNVPGGDGVGRYALGICAGLAHIHEKGVLHRDLKPSNVLVDDAEVPRIIDLGLARDTADNRTRLTQAGEVMGTVAYMAPEQLLGSDPTAAADVYSLGLIIYELLARRTIFTTGVAEQGCIPYPARLANRIPPVSNYAKDVSPALAQLLPHFLNIDPAARPRDGRTALALLGRALNREDVSGATDAVLPPPLPVVDPDQTPRTSRRIARPARSGAVATLPPPPAASPLRVVLALALSLGLAAGLVALLFLPRRTAVVARDPSPSASASADTSSPAGTPAIVRARQLTDRIAQHRRVLDEAWLVAFAARHKNDLRRRQTRGVADALREHLDRLGIQAAGYAFLPEAPKFFADPAVPSAQRWLLRSALCDLELIEYFCQEHGVEWPLPPVAGCAGPWDRPVDPHRLDMKSASTWTYGLRSGERFTPGRATLATFKIRPWKGEHALVWYSMLRWRSGVILDITLEGGVRRLLRHTHPKGGVKPVRVRSEFYDAEHEQQGPNPDFHMLAATTKDELRSYAGVEVPGELLGTRPWVQTRMIDLPYTPTGNDDPALVERVLTLIDRRE